MPYISTFSEDGVLISKKEIDISVEEYKKQKTNELRGIVFHYISSAGLDTATQQNAALGIYEPARCEAIKNYIAACRNEYLRCKGLILAATTNEAADSVQFQPPSVPENL
jgi:hypothetical protein